MTNASPTLDPGGLDRRPGDNPARPSDARKVTLLDLADRLLGRGVVVSGDITLSVADVDLVYVGLRLFLASAETAERLAGPSVSARSDEERG